MMNSSTLWTLGPLQIRINWLILACVLFTLFGFIRLGIWQLDRAGEKLAAQEAVEQEQLQSPRSLAEIDPPRSPEVALEELQNLHVALQGEYLNQRTVLVLAQFFDGQIGFEVVTPFRQANGGQLVLVSRGWTSGILPPNTPPRLQPVDGFQELTAQIHVPDPDRPILPSQIDASAWPLRVRSIELDVLENLLGEQLFPYVLRLTEDQPGMLVRHWPESNADIDTHLSYALQWFTFAVMVALAALLASSNLLSLLRDPEKNKQVKTDS